MIEKESQAIKLANEIMTAFYQEDRSGELLYLFCKELSKMSRLVAYGIDDENKFIVFTNEVNKIMFSDEEIKRKRINIRKLKTV